MSAVIAPLLYYHSHNGTCIILKWLLLGYIVTGKFKTADQDARRAFVAASDKVFSNNHTVQSASSSDNTTNTSQPSTVAGDMFRSIILHIMLAVLVVPSVFVVELLKILFFNLSQSLIVTLPLYIIPFALNYAFPNSYTLFLLNSTRWILEACALVAIGFIAKIIYDKRKVR